MGNKDDFEHAALGFQTVNAANLKCSCAPIPNKYKQRAFEKINLTVNI